MKIDYAVQEDSVLIVRNGHEPRLYYIEDLKSTNELLIGHIFNSILHTKKKTKADYGTKWISYRDAQGNVSPLYVKMSAELAQYDNDFDKYNTVLTYLGEDVLEVL